MANHGSAKQDRPAGQPISMRRSRQGGSDMTRWDASSYAPFAWMRMMQDQIAHAFGAPDWSPAIDVFQRGNDLVVRADVPGLTRDDITVDIADDHVTIRGERHHDHEEERDGVFRSERSYGSFCRVIPLPQGAIADSAKAAFNNGVLEIVLQAPSSEVRRGRRIEIREGAGPAQGQPQKKQDQQKG
jgi:HSP20 family molecular chaperone IbpA